MRRAALALLQAAILMATVATVPVAAQQGLFDTVARVNDGAVTRYELIQRGRLLSVLGSRATTDQEVLEELIDDRLKLDAARASELMPPSEVVQLGIEDFAAQANLTAEEFLLAIGEAGIERETIEDYIRVNLAWGDVVRTRFGAQARPSDAEIDRAIALGTGVGSARVLVSEVVLPFTPDLAQLSEERANAIASMRTTAQFESAARQFSVAPTRVNGGRLDWISLSDLPADIAPLFLTMQTGEVTAPIVRGEVVVLYQLRGLQDVAPPRRGNASLDYALVRFPVGTNLASERARIASDLDTCDDLFGIYKGLDESRLVREIEQRNSLNQSLARVTDGLDPGEIGILAPSSANSGGALVVLCGRTDIVNEDLTRDDIGQNLLQRRLNTLADGFLAQLRADAFIERAQ